MYNQLEVILDYKFKNIGLLEQAFMHTSLINELKRNIVNSNERLEFLGDAVLQIVVSNYLYKEYPNMLEGDLSKLRASLVCEGSFAEIARELQLGNFIKMSKGEMMTKGFERDSILADAFEAVIGALYLDAGIEEATCVVLKLLIPKITKDKIGLKNWDFKTRLQEMIQSRSQVPVVYKIVSDTGPDHNKVFTAEVSHNGEFLGRGEGRTKKEAEQSAAKIAIDKIKK